mgnify:CR=1 FL=1
MDVEPYEGPFPPDKCKESRYAQYEERDGLLFKLWGGSAVFWFLGGPAILIRKWGLDPKLRLIR